MERVSVDGVAYPAETDHPRALRMIVSPGYFDVFGVKPVTGRYFTDADGPDAMPVAILNERFVQRFMGGRDALGRHVRLGDDAAPWRTIVGVVPDMHIGGAFQQLDVHDEGVYVPLAQNVINFMNMIARTEGSPATHASAIQAAVNTIDPALPLYWVRSLDEQYHLDGWFFRAFGTLLMVFGIAALVLAVVGLYGVMSFSVGQRTREIGVRMALGAPESGIRGLVLGQAMRQLGIGLLLGTALAAVLSRALANLLFGVRPWDAAVFAIVVATLAASGLGASAIPARRAMRVDPIDALRHE
jgi:predicted permease